MKIAIHNGLGFNIHWIQYCIKENIPHKLVNCFDTGIIQQLEDCDALMWHHHHNTTRQDHLLARQLLFTLEQSGKKVFPNFNTAWHFDDKLGQKYLFEAINAPLVPTFAFFDKENAIEWANSTQYPKVFKLRNGSASRNVKLVKNKQDALKLINIAFGKGFSHQKNPWESLKENWRIYKLNNSKFGGVKAALKRIFYIPKSEREYMIEKGYVYFQEFIADNKFDVRVIVVDQKAFAIKRMVRENDFRASGSGMLNFKREEFDIKTIKTALHVAKKLKSQSAAFDFLYRGNQPLIGEISYGFPSKNFIEKCEGYWDKDLNWHQGSFNPYGWMLEALMEEINQSN